MKEVAGMTEIETEEMEEVIRGLEIMSKEIIKGEKGLDLIVMKEGGIIEIEIIRNDIGIDVQILLKEVNRKIENKKRISL